MKIWLPPMMDAPDGAAVIYGRLRDDAATPGAALITGVDGAIPSGADAWIVAPGLGGHSGLLARILEKTEEGPVMAALNGVGPEALENIRPLLETGRLVYLFDAREETPVCYLEQLTWLRARRTPFAIMSLEPGQLNLAAAMGAAHLIIPETIDIDFSDIERIARSGAPGALKPVSPSEIDRLDRCEASLSVVRAKAVDEVLEDGDLDIIVTEERGLSPHLKSRVAGLRLRYAILPGEPLNFGHLDMDMKNG